MVKGREEEAWSETGGRVEEDQVQTSWKNYHEWNYFACTTT
jgi:hypothetical protein